MTSSTTATRRSARRRLALLLCVAALFAAACSSDGGDTIRLGSDPLAPTAQSGEVESSANDEIVDFTYERFDGTVESFSNLPDGPVVLNFFASWCAPCISELPDFETVSQSMAGEVNFIGLAIRDRPEMALELVEKTGVTFTTGTDQNGDAFRIFEGIAMPTTVFLDAEHRVMKVHSGVLDVTSLTQTINDELLS